MEQRKGVKAQELTQIQQTAAMWQNHPLILNLNSRTEKFLVKEMNHMVNKGDIIQIKSRFRMPYSDNKNLISSCSQVLRQQDLSRKQEANIEAIKR